MALSELDDQELLGLPLDRLGIDVLAHLGAANEWNIHNFLVSEAVSRRGGGAKQALIEAVNWLLASGLIARGHPTQSHPESMIVTRLGHEVLASGLDQLYAQRRLSTELHPRLARVRSQIILGEYELAAFAAMREVEIRVRELSGLDASLVGVKLPAGALLRRAERWSSRAPLPRLMGAGESRSGDSLRGAHGFPHEPRSPRGDAVQRFVETRPVLIAHRQLLALKRTPSSRATRR